jgi:hypothetical protein
MIDKIMFSMIMSQVGLNGREWWPEYNELNFRDVMIVKIFRNSKQKFYLVFFAHKT